MNEIVKAKLETLPKKPGSYQYKDKDGTIIYVGKAKNLIDTVSLNVMIRRVASDEYSNGSHALRVYRWDNASGRKQKVAVNLDDDKTYLICFVTKNRFGASDDYQLIYEINMATNELKEIGFTRIIEEV